MAGDGLEVRLLGRFEVLRAGAEVELPPSKKARALLAYLVANDRTHDRGYLAGLLWDEREDERAALRWALSRLRPIVDDDDHARIVTDRDRVGFERRGAEVDLATVRSALREGVDRVSTATLEMAAARFRGELLEGLDLPDCYGFHAWCTAERQAARALRTSILSLLVERLGPDAPEQALAYARARLDIDPLAGAAQAAVVRLLCALGRQREADELYQGFRHRGRTSIDLERARALLRATAPEPPRPPPPLERLARSPFVGRQRELRTLADTLDAALEGGGSVVEIAGEAGLGKSRLVEELVHQARLRGARPLIGRCLEGEGSPAFLPFLDSLDAALAAENEIERLAGPDAALAARLSPRLAARLGETPAPLADATSERYLVFQAVATLLERLAAPAGAVLVIEDLHWIDEPSLALLRYLAPRLESSRLLVLATYRDEDLTPRQRDALVDLRRYGGTRLVLRGLAGDDVDALVTALAGSGVSSSLKAKLREITAGHPLFVQEILKHLIEENALDGGDKLSVPDGVRQVIGRRLARLSEPARRLLVLASPMRGAFGWDLVRALATGNEDELLDALDEVLAAQLLRENATGASVAYEFSHALVAQTLYESLPVPRRARLNRQITEAIERVHASDLEPHLQALAQHSFLGAEGPADKEKAAAYAIRAADRAAALLAFEEAARHCEHALQLANGLYLKTDIAEIHRRRGQALAVVSAWNEACEAFENALAAAAPEAVEWRAEVLVELGRASLWAMNMPAVESRARAAEELVRSLGREDLTLAIGGSLAQCLASDGKLGDANAKYDEVRRARGPRHVPSMALAPLTLYWSGRIGDAVDCAVETLAAARAAQDIVSLLVGLPPLGMALAARGRYDEAKEAFAEARAIGERHRATLLLARAVSMSTGIHLDLGDVDAAEDIASEARELARSAAWSPGSVSAGIDLVVCRLRRGDVGQAAALVEEVTREAEARKRRGSTFHDWLWAIRIAWARAEVAAAKGDRDGAEQWTAETLKLSEKSRPKYTVAALVTRARSRGKTKAALADLDRALLLAREAGDPSLILRAATPRQAIEPDAAIQLEIDAITANRSILQR